MNLNDLAANVLQQRSTPNLIADILREAILRGIFQEGQSLRQDEIAAQFGVSRIPVREALRQLEAEGLVTIQLNRGATVSVLLPEEMQELCEMRAALETKALQLAMPQLTEADLEKAAAILEAKQAVDAGHWVKLNWEFHATLYTPANRPRLLTAIAALHVNVNRYVRLLIEKINCQERLQKEHYQLLAACRQQDATAVMLLEQQIDAIREQLVDDLRQNAPAHVSARNANSIRLQ